MPFSHGKLNTRTNIFDFFYDADFDVGLGGGGGFQGKGQGGGMPPLPPQTPQERTPPQ